MFKAVTQIVEYAIVAYNQNSVNDYFYLNETT